MTVPVTNGRRQPAEEPRRSATDKDYRRAWLSLALYPFAFVIAFVVGEGLATLFGYEVGDGEVAPLWIALAAGLPALLVMAVPPALAIHFGRRAVAGGREAAKVPMYVAVGMLVMFVGLNALSYVVGLLAE